LTEAPDPRANPDLVGHDASERVLAEAMRSGRLHHAWLLLGPAGIGKATLAFRFARRLLAGPTAGGDLYLDPASTVFRRVAAGSHADLLTVERAWDDKKQRLRGEIVVADVRRIADFLHRTPAEGGWRVVVVDGAEDLNRNAANALLKVLEEPPPRAVLLLACSAAGRLLPTIRSRCRRLALTPLQPADLETALMRLRPDLDADERSRLAALSGGSAGRALALAGAGGVALEGAVARLLADPARLTTGDALRTADQLGRDEAAFTGFMELLRERLAATVREAARGVDDDRTRALAARGLDEWVAVWHALGTLQGETEGLHLDRREALVQGFRLLSGAA